MCQHVFFPQDPFPSNKNKQEWTLCRCTFLCDFFSEHIWILFGSLPRKTLDFFLIPFIFFLCGDPVYHSGSPLGALWIPLEGEEGRMVKGFSPHPRGELHFFTPPAFPQPLRIHYNYRLREPGGGNGAPCFLVVRFTFTYPPLPPRPLFWWCFGDTNSASWLCTFLATIGRQYGRQNGYLT